MGAASGKICTTMSILMMPVVVREYHMPFSKSSAPDSGGETTSMRRGLDMFIFVAPLMIMNFGDGDEASLDVGSQKYHLVVMDISLVLPMLIIYFEYGSKMLYFLVSCAVCSASSRASGCLDSYRIV